MTTLGCFLACNSGLHNLPTKRPPSFSEGGQGAVEHRRQQLPRPPGLSQGPGRLGAGAPVQRLPARSVLLACRRSIDRTKAARARRRTLPAGRLVVHPGPVGQPALLREGRDHADHQGPFLWRHELAADKRSQGRQVMDQPVDGTPFALAVRQLGRRPHQAGASASRRHTVWCRTGCGEAAECGPLGWWPCCSQQCWAAWKESEENAGARPSSTPR